MKTHRAGTLVFLVGVVPCSRSDGAASGESGGSVPCSGGAANANCGPPVVQTTDTPSVGTAQSGKATMVDSCTTNPVIGTSAESYPHPEGMPRSDRVSAKLAEIMANEFGLSKDRVQAGATLTGLGLDSLDHVELIMAIEEEFGMMISDADAARLRTMGDVAWYIFDQQKTK